MAVAAVDCVAVASCKAGEAWQIQGIASALAALGQQTAAETTVAAGVLSLSPAAASPGAAAADAAPAAPAAPAAADEEEAPAAVRGGDL